jgi:hypothetical protein
MRIRVNPLPHPTSARPGSDPEPGAAVHNKNLCFAPDGQPGNDHGVVNGRCEDLDILRFAAQRRLALWDRPLRPGVVPATGPSRGECGNVLGGPRAAGLQEFERRLQIGDLRLECGRAALQPLYPPLCATELAETAGGPGGHQSEDQ